MSRTRFASLTLAVAFALSAPLLSAPLRAEVPAPVDQAYPGTIAIDVDATDLAQRIFKIRQTVPVQAGALTLLFPQWLPGNHGPSGPIDKIAGLKITANGQPLAWKRDPLNVYAFNIDVPAGVQSLQVDFQY